MNQDVQFLKRCYDYPTWKAWASVIWNRITFPVVRFVCRIMGHRIHGEATSPESGGESLHCIRCGWSLNVWHN
jgi:hypothetical protein